MANQHKPKHGMRNHPAYKKWCDVKRRLKDKCFKHYAGKGIDIDPKWQDFEKFWEDMGPTYFEGASLDRVDNDKGYCYSNCRWVEPKQQSRNKTTTLYLGDKKLIEIWEENVGSRVKDLSYAAFIHRVNKQGLTVEEALSRPLRRKLKRK